MKTIIPLAMFGALLFCAPADAQGPATTKVAVSYADIDLSSLAGVRELDRRIVIAVRAACGAPSDADIEGENAVRKCRAELRLGALPQRERAIASAGRRETLAAAGQ